MFREIELAELGVGEALCEQSEPFSRLIRIVTFTQNKTQDVALLTCVP